MDTIGFSDSDSGNDVEEFEDQNEIDDILPPIMEITKPQPSPPPPLALPVSKPEGQNLTTNSFQKPKKRKKDLNSAKNNQIREPKRRRLSKVCLRKKTVTQTSLL